MIQRKIIMLIAVLSMVWHSPAQGFLSSQERYPRVRQAIGRKGAIIESRLQAHGLSSRSLDILLVAFKAEKRLDIYARADERDTYTLISSYPVCRMSGRPGPKRRQGDGQVPEGFYHIDRFNPSSSYHLSLGIDYPNASDRKKSTAANPGGDIFIHGSCVTVGCLPMTDDGIEEIYLYAVYARENGQLRIPVYIFPFEMTEANMERYSRRYHAGEGATGFWDNLKEGYDLFMEDLGGLSVGIDAGGNYTFRKERNNFPSQ